MIAHEVAALAILHFLFNMVFIRAVFYVLVFARAFCDLALHHPVAPMASAGTRAPDRTPTNETTLKVADITLDLEVRQLQVPTSNPRGRMARSERARSSACCA